MTAIVEQKIFGAKSRALLDTGKIYINYNGGFFPYSKDLKVLDEMIIDSDMLVFPQYKLEDIKIKQWDDGKHYYAYVGELSVEVDGISKWDSYKDTEHAAKTYFYSLNKKMFELKNR